MKTKTLSIKEIADIQTEKMLTDKHGKVDKEALNEVRKY